ncbi:hypothetical protein AYL99_08071 [Fonsecaea erecta]|uniref:Cytochrome P450 alkane hydroxylase n=1 Tax=Fonsecaea erecta TaxID=1367422 RepID=A0A178ZDT8_9EURO|nr:hypothetical protein AYL99_08071 [Fonsecaea erecta]OAP57333.1 hypothetical protein AYL99_08071 [Fonsecaea erecta]
MASIFTALGCIFAFYVYHAINIFRQRRYDMQMGVARGCQAPPRLLNQRPLGLDRLEQIFRADSESRLMELFLFHFRLWGTTLEQVFLGSQAFGTIEPANLEAILSTQFEDWGMGLRRKVMFPFFGDGIFTQEGADWKHSREMLRPQFVFKQYEDLEVFREPVANLLEALPANGVVDLQPFFFRLTLDVTTAFLFGESVHSLQGLGTPGESEFASAFNTAQDFIAKRLRLQNLYWLVGGRKFRQACSDVHRFADQIIDRNLSKDLRCIEGQEKYVFLDFLARNTPDRKALRSQIINILVAGRDTTACLISWTLFLLVRHPNVMDKLRSEITATFDNTAEVTRSDLRKMKYLQNVLKETLRLYPSVPVNSRTALKTTVLPVGGGPDLRSPVLVPKGASVAYSVYSMHRRPDFYGMDAEIFRPERWEEHMPLNDDPTNAKWGYLPFNGGPRTCLGLDFGLIEAAYTIVHLIQRFPVIRLPPGEKVVLTGVEKQTMTLVVSITEGCKVEVSRDQK